METEAGELAGASLFGRKGAPLDERPELALASRPLGQASLVFCFS